MANERRPGPPNRDPAEGAADHVNVPPTEDERRGRYPSGSAADEAIRRRAPDRPAPAAGDPKPARRDRRSSGGK